MRAIASFTGLILAASLVACAQSIGVPDIGLFGGSTDAPESTGGIAAPQQGQTIAAAPAEVPPLPSRNPKKAKAPSGRTLVAAAQPAPATEKPAPEKQAAEKPGFTLGSLSLFSGSDSVQTATSPVATYSMLAQQIHACWLTPGAPLLPNHGFHAEVAPNAKGDAKIIIYEKMPDHKPGIQVFRITISSASSGSVIASENRRLDAKLDAAFKADLARWAKGDERCRGAS